MEGEMEGDIKGDMEGVIKGVHGGGNGGGLGELPCVLPLAVKNGFQFSILENSVKFITILTISFT